MPCAIAKDQLQVKGFRNTDIAHTTMLIVEHDTTVKQSTNVINDVKPDRSVWMYEQ